MSLTPVKIPENGWLALIDDKNKKVINFMPVMAGRFYAVQGVKTMFAVTKEQLTKDCETAGYKI